MPSKIRISKQGGTNTTFPLQYHERQAHALRLRHIELSWVWMVIAFDFNEDDNVNGCMITKLFEINCSRSSCLLALIYHCNTLCVQCK